MYDYFLYTYIMCFKSLWLPAPCHHRYHAASSRARPSRRQVGTMTWPRQRSVADNRI